MSLPQGAVVWSAVYDCGIFWSYSFCHFTIKKYAKYETSNLVKSLVNLHCAENKKDRVHRHDLSQLAYTSFLYSLGYKIVLPKLYMGLDARKPVFGDLRTTVRSAPLLFAYWKESYLDLLQANFQFSSWSL